jgi:hypothetical protein
VKEVYDNYDFLKRLTKKRFSDKILADEACTYALDGLSRDDWRRLRAFKGKSSFRTYLGCVWCHLLEDFAIKKFGKTTPPQWIKNLGGAWEDLFRLSYCRRLTVQDAVEKILALVHAIREHLILNEEERLILTAHFVDGESITTIGKRLKRNLNQIHSRFRQLKEKIRASLEDLLKICL